MPSSSMDAVGGQRQQQPFLGYGVGLRRPHFDEIFAYGDEIDFLEILVENFVGFGGKRHDVLRRVADEFPIVLHGLGVSIGGPDPLDTDYLQGLEDLAKATNALWTSDHLCYSSGFGVEYHDLIPLPFTDEAVQHVVKRVETVKAHLSIPFALENPSTYISYADNEMGEGEFIREVVTRADCGLLLDINNIYVNCRNHGGNPEDFVDSLPLERVVQIHMAGHEDRGDVLIDTHGDFVCSEVMELYRYTLGKTGPVSTLLEWDNQIPELGVLVSEHQNIRTVGESLLGKVPIWQA